MRTDILEKKNEILIWIGENKSKRFISKKLSCSQETLNRYLGKMKLINEGIKEHKCENCNKTEWLGELIPIELHHIDGDILNNTLKNLEILCPNCHTLTDNYRGEKNREKWLDICECGGSKHRSSKICYKCNIKNLAKFNTKIKKSSKYNRKNICKCGEIKYKESGLCFKCYSISRRKVKRPDYESLIKDIEDLGYVKTGEKYNVSDNSIRKWIKNYEKE